MIKSGVYLITRSNFVFDNAPTAQLAVVIVGTITLLFGAIIGMAKDGMASDDMIEYIDNE